MLKNIFSSLIFIVLISGPVFAGNVASIRSDSVLVRCKYGKANAVGSGVLFNRGSDAYVLTAHHVIADAPKAIKAKKPFLLEVRKEHYGPLGIKRGMTQSKAKLIAYDVARDIALLKVDDAIKFRTQTKFYLSKKSPKVGTKIWHVGSPHGTHMSNSLFDGIISYLNRNTMGMSPYPKDQINVQVIPGCSGGGVFLADSFECIGIVVIASHSQGLFVPIRQIIDWAKENNIYWVFDSSMKKGKLPNLYAKKKAKKKQTAELEGLFEHMFRDSPPLRPRLR
jgi:S1-C subfamily serine protease